MSTGERWVQMAEAGSAWAMRFGAWCHRRLGRRSMLVLVALSAVYFTARRAAARRASRAYLKHLMATPGGASALGRWPLALLVLRHIFEFSLSVYDRVVVWGGAIDTMSLEHDGSERIFEMAESGRGALLLGAHIGALDMLGFIARRHRLTVNVVAYYDNAEQVNAFLESLGPDQVKMIHLDPGSVQAVFHIRACIERGEFVVVMADRAVPGTAARDAAASFLGRSARFPLGPFLLAGVLGCPVYLALCVRSGSARYTTVMRPIAEAARVPRREREKWAREALAHYVALLEEVCQRRPFQWFNFYDFWEEMG